MGRNKQYKKERLPKKKRRLPKGKTKKVQQRRRLDEYLKLML